MILHLKVKAGARKSELTQSEAGEWQLKIAAPPVDGKANDAIIEFLAKHYKVPKRAVTILSGHTAPFKKIEIDGI
jgi:uncharacterized protein (TIGR00251 family)